MRLPAARNTPRRHAAPGAWTLLEMIIAISIGSIVLAAVLQTWAFTSRSFVAMANYDDLNRTSRYTLDQMTRDIREAKVVGYFSTNRLVFTNTDGSAFAYNWDPATQMVTKEVGEVTNSLLKSCDSFCFYVYQRNPTNGFLFPYSSTNAPNLTKLVQVTWHCSRRFLNESNTESVQTAKIVLRN